ADHENDTARAMLTLCGISYRGNSIALPEKLKRLRLRALMDACMTQFSAVKDRWKIVWGPADFSATSPGLDDVLMYIAQRVDSPSTVAITIRGTNPMSPHD